MSLPRPYTFIELEFNTDSIPPNLFLRNPFLIAPQCGGLALLKAVWSQVEDGTDTKEVCHA